MAYRFLDKYKEFFGLRWLLRRLDIIQMLTIITVKTEGLLIIEKSKKSSIRSRAFITTITGFSDTDL